MAHNGHRGQLNPWFINFGGAHAFINAVKGGDGWKRQDTNASVADLDTLDEDGYPYDLSAMFPTGYYTVFWIPDPNARPGNWVVKWTGTADISRRNFSHTIVSGSTSGTNGRFVLTPTGTPHTLGGLSVDIGPRSVTSADPMTSFAMVHEDDEEAYDNGEVFTADFKTICRRYGVIRFLDWNGANGASYTKWIHRPKVNSCFWGAQNYDKTHFRGTTSNVGDDYTLDLGDGGTPSDKDYHVVKFNATASGNSPTLNGILIVDNNADPITIASRRPTANTFGNVVYDATLNSWVKHGGDTDLNNRWTNGGVPYEMMLRLCEETGTHPWINIPFLSLDAQTGFATDLATYFRDNAPSWMIPRYEPGNEIWNSAGGFEGTRYAWNKGQFLAGWGGTDFQHDHWYGKVLSTTGQAISAVYGDDRSKYKVIAAYQAVSFPSPPTARLSGKYVSVDGGSAASNWATTIAFASYWDEGYTNTQVLADAHEWNALGTEEEQEAYVADWLLNAPNRNGSQLDAMAAAWVAHANSFNMDCMPYEGGYGPNPLSSNIAGTITGASQAAQCVLTITSSTKPPVGSSVTPSGIVGMTQLNGNTYTVVSVVGNSVTIDVDSTGFSAYSSGGSATYVNSMTFQNDFREMVRLDPQMADMHRLLNTRMWLKGVRFPSTYALSGRHIWSNYQPDIYAPYPAAEGNEEFSTSATPLRFRFNLS